MSESVPFRSAAAPVAETPPLTSATGAAATTQMSKADTSDAPPSLYQEINKQPYAAKFLDVELYTGDDDFIDMREQATDLDAYVLKQIKARGLRDSPESYKEVIDAIYKQIGKSSNEHPTQALKRLSVAAKAISRLESAKLPPVLSAKSLTPDEFEGVHL